MLKKLSYGLLLVLTSALVYADTENRGRVAISMMVESVPDEGARNIALMIALGLIAFLAWRNLKRT